MVFKTGLMRTVVTVALLALLGCTSGAPENEVPAAAEPAPPTEEEVAAAQAALEARQKEVTQVLSSLNRESFIGESAIKGNPNAEIIVVKFSDFECPYCAVAAVHMKDFVEQRGDEVIYVYKHFPLKSIHPEAEPAAKASWAAAQQNQFWLYHDGLFANQQRLGDDLYQELAEQIGLDVDQFNRDRNSDAAQAAVDADLALAEKLKLQGTPAFLMDGLLIPPSISPESFGQLLDNLQAARTAAPQN